MPVPAVPAVPFCASASVSASLCLGHPRPDQTDCRDHTQRDGTNLISTSPSGWQPTTQPSSESVLASQLVSSHTGLSPPQPTNAHHLQLRYYSAPALLPAHEYFSFSIFLKLFTSSFASPILLEALIRHCLLFAFDTRLSTLDSRLCVILHQSVNWQTAYSPHTLTLSHSHPHTPKLASSRPLPSSMRVGLG